MTRQSLRTVIDIVKDKKKIAAADKIHLIPGVEYTPANIAQTADAVWGCAK
jgi:apolipoprotein N-acyltransferase